MGINLQAVVDSNSRVITTAENELHERATAAAIRKNILSCLAKLDILEKQIHSITTDDGSNVFNIGELMRSNFALPEHFPDQNDENEYDVTEASERRNTCCRWSYYHQLCCSHITTECA